MTKAAVPPGVPAPPVTDCGAMCQQSEAEARIKPGPDRLPWKDLHVRASLGRFAATDDAFHTLSHVPVDYVKLSSGAVGQLDGSARAKETIVNALKRLQSEGKLTIVPMIENASVLSTLWQAGANYIQGHYLQEARPRLDYDFATEDH